MYFVFVVTLSTTGEMPPGSIILDRRRPVPPNALDGLDGSKKVNCLFNDLIKASFTA